MIGMKILFKFQCFGTISLHLYHGEPTDDDTSNSDKILGQAVQDVLKTELP